MGGERCKAGAVVGSVVLHAGGDVVVVVPRTVFPPGTVAVRGKVVDAPETVLVSPSRRLLPTRPWRQIRRYRQ
jgi:hypothetical protein